MKLKNNKSLKKRLKITKKGKLLRRPVHQDHFNAKYHGHDNQKKHGTLQVKKVDTANLKKLLPYI